MFLLYLSTIQIFIICICFVSALFVLPILFLRCFCWYLSWKLNNQHGIKFRVQKVGFISLKQIKIQLPTGSILEIENLWISGNLFNAKCKTLLTLCISDLRFQGDFLQLSRASNSKTQSDTQEFDIMKWVSLLNLFKISVLFNNASAMQLGAPNEEFIFHMTLQELSLHLNSNKIMSELNALLTSITVKMFQHYQSPGHSCLAQFSVTTQCMLGFSNRPNPKVEKITISVRQPEILLYEDILFFSKLASKSYIKAPSQKDFEVNPNNTIFQCLSSIPQSISIDITETSIRCVKEEGHKALSADLKDLAFIYNQELDVKAELILTINSLNMSAAHNQLLNLNHTKLVTKITEEKIDFSFLLQSFHLSHSLETLLSWPMDLTINPNPPSNKLNWKQKYLPLINGHILNCSIEVKDTQFDFKFLDSPNFVLACNNGKWSMNSILESDGNLNDTNMEFLLENVWCSSGESYTLDVYNLKKFHFWTMPLVIGVALIQIKQNKKMDFRIEAMLDNVQFEWNMVVCSLLKKLCLPKASKSSKPKSLLNAKPSFSLQTTISNTNLFFLTEKSTCVMVRLDNINLDTLKKSICFEGIRAVQLGTNSKSVPCIKSSEFKSHVLSCKILRFSIDTKSKEYTIQILSDFQVIWSNNLHMSLLTLCQDFPFQILSKTSEKKQEPINKYNVIIHGPINLKAILSKQYTLFCHLNEFKIHKTPFILNLTSSQASIGFNKEEIFYFQNFKFCSNQETEKNLLHRRCFEELQTETNKLFDVSFDEIKLTYTYKFNFAEAFTEQTISIVKWLKILHHIPKSLTLAPDMIIKIKVFTFELPDDPFEVKLRDNYVLLKDEYLESLERKRMLNEKIEQLRKTNLLLSTAKLDELNSSLAKMNADIYVKRSRQLYNDSSMRTSLSLCTLEDIELIVLADSSFHGHENIYKIIQEMDSESHYPDEAIEFSTLWCRLIKGTISNMLCQLRNFPQPYLEVRELHIWGRLAGAEQVPNQRSRRFSIVEITEPWENINIERSMQPLKFFHDLKCDMQSMCAAYGPCWEPIMSQVSLAYEYISRPSLDPSPPLAWWDKSRLLYHGRFSLSVQHMIFFLHASLDPYNTTEEMEITWTEVIIDWTHGKILTRGDLDVYVHTASKYDDCRLLHMPNLKFGIKLDWLCIGNPNDHLSVSPCAPDKVPEYSINQTHDSFRAFRSQNLSLALTLESKVIPLETTNDVPTLLLFSSTLRWFENLKLILSGVVRLTRRGKLFDNVRPRKPPLSRHYSSTRLSLNIHKSQICYWTSFAKNKGLELLGGRFSHSSEHSLSLVTQDDRLIHRPQPNWIAQYMNCDLGDSEMWLYNSNVNNVESQSTNIVNNRTYFFSVNRVSYGREANVKYPLNEDDIEDTPTHRLVIHGLKGAWIESNRDVIFSMFDSYVKGHQLKRNLATDALKSFKVENCVKPTRSHANSSSSSTQLSSPCTSLKADSLLQKLVAEAEASPSMVYTEEIENTASEQELYGVLATQTDDVLYKNWLIELVNSQVMLKGSETSGYVIVSASKTQILQRIHQPTWKEHTLYSKTTWVGSLECMQYYATVDVGEPGPLIDNIMWLSVDNIEEKESMVIADIPDMVGSGHSVGGIVTNHVGGSSDPSSAPLQLQRIVSRCGCQFYYASYGENLDQHSVLEYVPPLPEDSSLLSEETCVDSFALTHHDLNICTNSSQYSMILDIVNNLLLYVEPRKKEARERLQRMRFQLQLCSIEDQRKPILQLQNRLRSLLFNLKILEKEAYQLRLLGEEPDEGIVANLLQVENDINRHKELINNLNDELTMMISCYKETQMSVNKTRQRSHEESASTERHNQVCFKHAQWRLTDKDGQLGIADLILSNFIYSKISKSNDSVEHLLELGYVKVTNLLPNQIYKDVLQPTELQPNIPLDRKRALRIFCRENAPVGGISVKEHLEVNVVPITLSLTKAFYMEMMKFFFPGRDTEKTDDAHNEEQPAEASATLRVKKQKQRGAINTLQKNDIEKMKERAKKNQTFLYIKIPQVPIKASFKGDKNIEDLRNSNLFLPTLEYHNRTWTWLDLFLELKSVSKKVLLPQAIKQKIQIIKSKQGGTTSEQFPQDEDEKAALLFGTKLVGPPEKGSKKGFFHKLTKQ